MDIAGLQPHLDPDQRATLETGARLPTEQRIRELYALARTGTLLGLRPFCEAPDLAEVFTHLVEECQRAREPEHTKYVGGQSEVGHHVDSVELNENDLAHLKDAKIEPVERGFTVGHTANAGEVAELELALASGHRVSDPPADPLMDIARDLAKVATKLIQYARRQRA